MRDGRETDAIDIEKAVEPFTEPLVVQRSVSRPALEAEKERGNSFVIDKNARIGRVLD